MTAMTRSDFDRQFADAGDRLAATIRRFAGHPDETDDLVQQTAVTAWEKRDSFREGSQFSTWLCAIGSNLAIDFLRRQKRWRTRAQVAYANECLTNESLGMEVGQVYANPDFAYDVFEHVRYCFTCVGRSLNPDEYGAVVLREIQGLANRDAAKALGVSESVFRHRLAAGRKVLKESFEGLCTLVNKKGVCYQCKGLRDFAPPDRQGPDVPAELDLDERLKIVAEEPETEKSAELHEVFWRRTRELEEAGRGSTEPTDCGQDAEETQP